MANNLLINNLSSFFLTLIKMPPHSPASNSPLYTSSPHVNRPFSPRIQALICPPFYVSTSVSISSFIFSRTTHSLSPADQAHCRTKRLAQCLCCACTHMYIFILCYIMYIFIRTLFRYFFSYIYYVLQIWKLFIQNVFE